jgi:hypothetical protein
MMVRMSTIRVYVSGWVDYEVENPVALVDASSFTPAELDPAGTGDLAQVPTSAWSQIPTALIVEVSKRAAQNPAPPPPGVRVTDQHITYGLQPPQDTAGA